MPEPLHRALSLPQLVVIGIGTIVGAGIYSVVGAAAGLAGPATWLGMALAGLAAFLTALSYAELVSAHPRAGAEYQFLRAAFPRLPLLAWLAGFFIAFNAAATAAAVALAFGGYLQLLVPAPAWLAALGLLVACTALNIAGIRESAGVGIALIVVEVGGLVLLTALGFAHGEPASALAWPAAGQWHGVSGAAALVFFAYVGFEDMSNLAEEAHAPRRDLPRALLASVLVTTVLYVGLTWALLALVDPATLGGSSAPLATAGARLAPWVGHAMTVAALFATASTALFVLVAISRLVFGMARDGDLPAALARTGASRRTPWAAALALFAVACALLPLGEVKTVASLSALGILAVFTGVHAALIALRLRPDAAPAPFRVRGTGRGVRLPAVLGIVMNLGLMTQFEGRVYLVAGAAAVAGLLLYALRNFRQQR